MIVIVWSCIVERRQLMNAYFMRHNKPRRSYAP